MAQKIEDVLPPIQSAGLNSAVPVDFSSSATVKLPAGTTINGSSLTALGTITSTSAQALAVGRQGLTGPALNVDSSTASQTDGLNVKGLAVGNGVQVKTITTGTNAPLTVDAAGSGNISIGSTSTGYIFEGRACAGTILSGVVNATIATQNGTPTPANLFGGLITHTSTTGAGTLTLPTGTAMDSALTGVGTGDSQWTLYANVGNQTVTITAASGFTITGTAAVPAGKNAQLYSVRTGTNTWVCNITLSA